MYVLLFIVNYFNTRDKCPLFDAGILENYTQNQGQAIWIKNLKSYFSRTTEGG